jgi:hypothetical protein
MSTDFWDEQETHTPNDELLGTAIQVWAAMEDKARAVAVTVGDAATIFNITPRRAARAIVKHYWMFMIDAESRMVDDEAMLTNYSDEALATMIIEHEGE